MNGLQNIGNTCYLNSALQFLFNIDSIIYLIINTSNTYPNFNMLKNFILEYKNNNNKVLNPVKIKDLISLYQKNFIGFNQNDSSEFLIYLLDFINDNTDKKLNNCIGIQINIDIKCKRMACLKSNNHFENEKFLFLDLNDNLDNSYRQYKSNEILKDDNEYSCEHCNKKSIARRKTQINKWPKDLIIILKRFDNKLRKLNNDIDIPFNWRHNYELKGFILHSGGLSSGHYVYYGEKDSNWYLFNDSSINIINNIKEILKKSYILHYKLKT